MKYSRIVKILCGYVAKLWQLVAILWLTSCMTDVVAMKLVEMPINPNAQQLKQAIADNQVATVTAILKEDGYINPEARAEFLCAIKKQEVVLIGRALGKLLTAGANYDTKPRPIAKLAQIVLSLVRQDFASLDMDFLMQLYPKQKLIHASEDIFDVYDVRFSDGAVDVSWEPTPVLSNLSAFNLNVFLLMLDTITFFIDDIKQVNQAIELIRNICNFPTELSCSEPPCFAQLVLSAYARQDQTLWRCCAQLAKKRRGLNMFVYMLHEYAIHSYAKEHKTTNVSDNPVPGEQELGALIILAKQAQHLLYEPQKLKQSPWEKDLCHCYEHWIIGRSYLDTVIRDLSYRDLHYYARNDSAVKLYRLRDGFDSNVRAHMKILEAGLGEASCDALAELVEIFLQNQPTTTARLDELLTTIDPVFLRRIIPRIILQCHKHVLGKNGNTNQLLHHLLESHPEVININSQDPDSHRTVFVQALALNDFERAYLLMTHFNADCHIKDQDGIKLVDLGAQHQLDPYLLQIPVDKMQQSIKVTTLALDTFGLSTESL